MKQIQRKHIVLMLGIALQLPWLLCAQNPMQQYWILNQTNQKGWVWDQVAAGRNNNQVDNGSGTWDLNTTRNWTPNGGTANSTWVPCYTAAFGGNPGVGAAGTVTLATNMTADSVAFRPAASGNFTITANDLSGCRTAYLPIFVDKTLVPTVASTLNSSTGNTTKGVTKYGEGTLYLTGQNRFTGNLTILNGIVKLAQTGGILHNTSGTPLMPIIVKNGGTLETNWNRTTQAIYNDITIEGTGYNGGGAISNLSTVAYKTDQSQFHSITLSGDASIRGTGAIQLYGWGTMQAPLVLGAHTLTLDHDGTPTNGGNGYGLMLDNAAATGTGVINVKKGELFIYDPGAITSFPATASITVGDGSTNIADLKLANNHYLGILSPITLNNGVIATWGGQSREHLNSPITLAAGSTNYLTSNSQRVWLWGKITGAGNLQTNHPTFVNSGGLTLAPQSNNDYTGTTLVDGTDGANSLILAGGASVVPELDYYMVMREDVRRNSTLFAFNADPWMGSGRWQSHCPWSDGTLYYDINNGQNGYDRVNVGGKITMGTAYIMNFRTSVANNTNAIWQNGTRIANGGNTNNSRTVLSFTIGGGLSEVFANASVGEIITLKKYATDAERQIVQSYLAHKWGITTANDVGTKTQADVTAALGTNIVQWYDFSDLTTQFQDVEATIPAVEGDANTVALVKDKSTYNNDIYSYFTTRRPYVSTQANGINNLRTMKFNGTALACHNPFQKPKITLCPTGGTLTFGAGNTNTPSIHCYTDNQFGAGTVINFANAVNNWTRLSLGGTTQTLAGFTSPNASNTQGSGVVQGIPSNMNYPLRYSGAKLILNGTGTYDYNGYIRDNDNSITTYNTLTIDITGGGTHNWYGTNYGWSGTTRILNGSTLSLNTLTNNANINLYGDFINNATFNYSAAATTNNNGVTCLRKKISGNGVWNIDAPARIDVYTNKLSFMGIDLCTTSGQINLTNWGNLWLESSNIQSTSPVFLNGENTIIILYNNNGVAGNAQTKQIGTITGNGTIDTNNGTGILSIGNDNGTGTFSGLLKNSSNTLSLIKNGTGTQILTGNNNYTGTTTINGGILQIGDNTANSLLGAGIYTNTITFTNNGLLVYHTTSNQLLTGLISGAGGITQNGTGILSIGGGNSLMYGVNIGNGGAWVNTNTRGNDGSPGAGGSGACAGANLGGNPVNSGVGGNGFVAVQYFDGLGNTIDYDYISATNAAYAIPAGTVTMKIWAVGAGASGSGGYGLQGSVGGGGGGAGGVAWATVDRGAATTLNITIGAGGTSTTTNGIAGGNTIVTINDVILTANGGGAGNSSWPCGGTGGDGGTATVTGVVLASGTVKGGNGTNGGGSAGGAIGNNGAIGPAPTDVSGLQNAIVNAGSKNTYTGLTTINEGTLKALSARAFGYGIITINPGGTLDRNGFAIPNTIINNGGTVIN